MNKIICIEGNRNVGKTYLINSLNIDDEHNYVKYKFPYVDFYNNCYTSHLTDNKLIYNNHKELYYLTFGNDLTILDLFKKNLIDNNLLIDRGILSNIVFGIQAKRISYKEGKKCLDYIIEHYSHLMDIVYINSIKLTKDNRNKDIWQIYNQEETHKLYNQIITDYKDKLNIYEFNNMYDNDSVDKFNLLITDLLT